MQTIYLDVSNRGATPRIYAKQSDVGRKFVAVITDGGVPFEIPEDALISIWYDGASGSGNYTEIDKESAVSVSGNRITVSLIQQMLSVPGDGEITIIVNSTDGKQIGLWNIQCDVERVAGWGSESAKDYFSAFSNATENLLEASKLFLPDKTLTQTGRPAEAYETGLRISAVEGRLNEIANLPEGSTTGDAELADARVGYDGKSYENVGEHIRDVGKLAHNTSFAAENLVGNIPILVSRHKDSDGGLARRYTTEMKLIGDAKYLDKIEVPILIDRGGGYSGVHTAVVAVANGRISRTEPIVYQWLEIPDGESSGTATVNIGEWFLPGDTIIVSVLDASTSGILMYPYVTKSLELDWLVDMSGDATFPDGSASEYNEVRFVGTATFYDTIKNDAKTYISYKKQSLTAEQQAQARENIGVLSADRVVDLVTNGITAPEITYEEAPNGYWDATETWVINNGGQSSKRTNLIEVVAGMKFAYQGKSTADWCGVYWYDADNNLILHEYFNNASGYKVFTAPTNAAFVRFSSFAWSTTAASVKLEVFYLGMGSKTDIVIEEGIGGYWDDNNTWVAVEGFSEKRTNLILVNSSQRIIYTGWAEWNVQSVAWYAADGTRLSTEQYSHYKHPGSPTTVTITPPTGAVLGRFCSIAIDNRECVLSVSYEDDNLLELLKNGNFLFGKKYVACGDSFTAGDFPAKTDETWDVNASEYKTYCWHIARRNNMTLVNEAVSGSTMYNNGNANAFSIDRYKQIPTDADYITLCFGLNDLTAGGAIGTLSDTTNETVMGAWNIVLEYLITNMPYAKIGIIIADAYMNTTMRDAIVSVAKYWGIPYLDLKGDTKVPMLIGGRYSDTTVSTTAVALRNAAFQNSDTDSHPNAKGHAYRSTIIENFMRSL